MTAYDFDLFVIGAGSGGVRAARIASNHGAKVAIAEEFRVGGTCVIRGCVPKKLMVYASHFAENFEDAVGFGWDETAPQFSWPKLIANKDREIDRLNGIYIRNLEGANVEIFQSRAEFVDDHTISLASLNKTVTAKTILIATGGTPWRPESIPGIEHTITSNEVFHLEQIPKRVAVVGGGYIAVEFAGIFNGLGAETTLLYRGEKILRGFDEDVRSHLTEEMVKKGINIITPGDITRIAKSQNDLIAELNTGESITVDEIMYATGRNPATDGLGLEKAGVTAGKNGEILVDADSKTNIDHIYAVGDVTDRVALTPVAIREGHTFADQLYGPGAPPVDHSTIPTAVFSQPEMGTVGLTEEEALAAHADLDIYKAAFRPMKHTLSGRDEKMFMKLIIKAEDQKVLGCHIIGPDAGEMAQLLGIAVKMGATKADFDATMAVHPTAAEELVTMRSISVKIRNRIAVS